MESRNPPKAALRVEMPSQVLRGTSSVAFRARLGALLLGLALAAGSAEALPFVVNSTLDTPDAVLNGVCATAGAVCTLRAAIQESNFGGVGNTITFALGAGPYTIAVGAAGLPFITRAVTIDGYSQAGSSANTLAVGSNAVLLIELNGLATGAGVNGLSITAPTTVRGLVINRFAGYGIQIAGGGAGSVSAGNYVGTNTLGTVALGNNRDGAGFEGGIGLSTGSVTIGGTAPADRNLVSGHALNFSRGIELYNSSGNTIQGNYVGTNAAGTARLDNVGAGIGVDGDPGVGSDNNLIGGAVAGAGNLCSGGTAEGIYVSVDSNANTIQGNIIGLNAAGTLAIPNGTQGIKIQSPGNTVGGDTALKRNLISGNTASGILVEGEPADGNIIQGNYVGTDIGGTLDRGNGGTGITVYAGADNTRIGGSTLLGVGNLLSGNNLEGINIQDAGTTGTIVQGNKIGTNAAGGAGIPNSNAGVSVEVGATGTQIGGIGAGEGNVIAFNGFPGVGVKDASTTASILGNSIYSNTQLGIDVAYDLVTANDALDVDTGPNDLLNFPVINNVSVVGASLVVGFSLDVPAGSYRVEFFRNPVGVDIPNGEGQIFAGFKKVTHTGGGLQSFSATIAGASGDRITATTSLCSDGGVCAAFSETSEFSANLIVTPTNYRSIGTAPDDSTGSVNTTNTSPIVGGVGTSWQTINRGRGDVISICDQPAGSCTSSTNYTVLAVQSNTQLVLTTPYTGSTGPHDYTIGRQFRGLGNAGQALIDWENCIDGGPCTYFGAGLTGSLVADNRSEVGIAYKDSVFVLPADLSIQGSTTDAAHTITLTADGSNRHNGTPGAGVVVDESIADGTEIEILDGNVTVEWLETVGTRGVSPVGALVVRAFAGDVPLNVLLQNLLIHDLVDPGGTTGVMLSGNVGGMTITLRNTMLWEGDLYGIWGDEPGNNLLIENCSIDEAQNGIDADRSTFTIRNTIVTSTVGGHIDYDAASGSLVGSNNTSSDATALTYFANPLTAVTAASIFVTPNSNLHLKTGANTQVDTGLDRSGSFVTDIDAQLRPAGAWDRGADERLATALFRSVGITATALASGAANALTISGSTATFGSGLPPNIGVGDVIQYDSDGNNSIDALAFIQGRTNSQTYLVKNKNGAAPTAVVGDNNWGIYRAYTSLFNWELQTENPNILEPVENDVNPALNLVTANTIMFVACYGDGADTTAVFLNGWTTGVANYIKIFTPVLSAQVGITQRHSGVWDTTKYRIEAANTQVIDIGPGAGDVWIDGLQIYLLSANANGHDAINIDQTTNYADHRISNNIIRAGPITASAVYGIYAKDATGPYVLRIWNNIIYGFNAQAANTGIYSDGDYGAAFTIYAYNNTVYNCQRGYFKNGVAAGPFILKNNIAYNNTDNYDAGGSTFDGSSTNNLSGPGADAQMPLTAARNGVAVTFVLPGGSPPNFHLAPGDSGALNFGAILSADANLAVVDDIDGQVRQVAWDIGADDANGTTAVKLMSFEARPLDSAISLAWQTASELDNLGFHVYRALSENGPWTRVTASLIPGLGSSAVGRTYSFCDGGLTNGVRYFYRLDDVDASSKTTSHGPVSAVPLVGAAGDAPGSEAPGASRGAKKNASSASCPEWVLAAYGSSVGSDAATTSLRCTRHGDPEAVSLSVVSRDARSATLELKTGGFYALREPAGTVRVFVPGFDFPQDERAAALPIRRALVDAVVGRRVQLGGVRALDLVSFKGLVPSGLGKAEMQVGQDGTVRATRRASTQAPRRFPKSQLATLLPSLFQGEQKSAVVEIAPLRFEAERQRLVLAKRVLVRLLFTGREAGESGRGSLGRAPRVRKPVSGEILARLYSTSVGLHGVSFEQVFPGRARGVAASRLRLERQGELVSFHLEPVADSFGPGSRLYFYAERSAASTDFTGEVAFELVSGAGGIAMPLQSAAPGANAVATASFVSRSFETNRFYQPGLLEAPDLWLWEALASGATRVKSFSLAGVSGSGGGSGTAELDVFLQGASESGQAVDHHVSVSVNGTPVGEAQFAGKQPYRMSLSLPGSLLREGANELSLTNVADTGVTSYVFLDRFTIAHPQLSSLAGGRFDGTWPEGGSVSVQTPGLVSGPVMVVDVGGTGGRPSWLSGIENASGSVRFRVEAGHRYWVGSDSALFSPRVSQPQPTGLKSAVNQADYLLIAPRAFLTAAEPLVQRRQDQGLQARAVAFEEIADAFGHGQASAEAIQAFLAYAFQSWARPSPRYVLLLGDSSYDPRNFMGASPPSPLPALLAKTSYLWTVSDPLLAAVNGEDPLPDLAIGRLPAATVEQAQMLVEKLLAWEDSGQGLAGQATLVADNPDIAGDFEADARDIAQSYLAGRSDLILVRELGAETRPRVLDALNSGLSYLSYVGHGGAAVWASENVWNSWDAASLQAQSRQPLLVTMNCLNGYFVAPSFDSLSESLLKAEGRGAIASFSPSGLSLDGPAHQYHRALMAELTSGRHERLGDALLSAQKAYAQTGLMPELLSVYHVLGDPAMKVR